MSEQDVRREADSVDRPTAAGLGVPTLDTGAALEAGSRRGHPARRWIVIAACAAVGLSALVLFGAQLAPKPITLSAQTAAYDIRLGLDGATLGRRVVTVEVGDSAAQPVAAQVELHASMPEMGMVGPAVLAEQIAPGRYEASGELFTMLGDWTITVRVTEPGSASPQEAVFTVTVVP
jgi:hypothetical protein